MNVAATRSDASERSASSGPARSSARSAGRPRATSRGRPGRRARRGTGPAPGRGRPPRPRRNSRRAADGGAHHLPRVLAAERRVAARRDVHPRVDEGAQPPQVRQVVRRHIGRVLLAALGDEVRLGDDRQPAQVRQGLGPDDRAVLDPVAGQPSREVKRGEREHELDARHAVHRRRPAGGVRAADPVGEVVKRRQRVVVEHDLDRPGGDRPRRRVHPGRRHAVQALRDRRASARKARSSSVAPGVASVKPVIPNDAAFLLTAPRSAAAPGTRPGEPAVHPPQPPGRAAVVVAFHPAELAVVEAQLGGGERVDHPQRAGAVLHPHRAPGDKPVESVAVKRPGDRLVVADGAQPRARRQVRVGRAQPRGQLGRASWSAAARR